MTVQVQNQSVPIVKMPDGTPLNITIEWRRCLTDAFKLINELQASNQALADRLTSAGIP